MTGQNVLGYDPSKGVPENVKTTDPEMIADGDDVVCEKLEGIGPGSAFGSSAATQVGSNRSTRRGKTLCNSLPTCRRSAESVNQDDGWAVVAL